MKFLKLYTLFLLLLSVFGCQKGKESSSNNKNSEFLRISFASDVRSLDPRVGTEYPSVFAAKMLFEGLMRKGLSGAIEPAMAESFTISEDQKTYAFKLRAANWSNGDPVTAHDFAHAWLNVINPKNSDTLGAENFYLIKNVRDVVRGEKSLDEVGICVIDSRTLQVELEHPTPYFLDLLATSPLFPVNARVDQENPNWANNNGDAFVCNGPFSLDYHKIDNEIFVVKNLSYWDSKHVKLPGIRILIIKDAMTRMNLFEKGQLQWIGRPLSPLPENAIETLKNKGKISFCKTLGLSWFFVNVKAFPFHNKKMRKAFSYAIDRESIAKFITQCQEIPAMGVLPFSLATQEEPFFCDNNPSLANQLFNEALEEMGLTRDTLPPITLNLSGPVAEAVQQQWSDVLGIKVHIQKQQWKSHFQKFLKGDYQLLGMRWQSALRDPIYIMQTFREAGNDGTNVSNWKNQEYQDLLDAAERETDPFIRRKYFNQAERLLMEEMPVIPICFSTMPYAKSDRLENVYVSDVYDIDFRWSYLKEAQ